MYLFIIFVLRELEPPSKLEKLCGANTLIPAWNTNVCYKTSQSTKMAYVSAGLPNKNILFKLEKQSKRRNG